MLKSNYLENLSDFKKKYFSILSNDFPEFLIDYINTKEMLKQDGISVSCGTIYSKLFSDRMWYSSLDHSVGVALIIWNFTKDKKQTIAGLLHDIATPVFKHAIDYMNEDYENQESTELETENIIRNSRDLMDLLKRDNFDIREVSDYHIYSIADNDTPRLSADRLEYTLSNGLGAILNLWNLDEVKEIYDNIEIMINEDGIEELGFKDKNLAENFVKNMSTLSMMYNLNKTTSSMQFIADILKIMKNKNLITVEDLYKLSEKEVIDMIENCEIKDISEAFKNWKNVTEVIESDEEPSCYFTSITNAKVRYINPLVRIKDSYLRLYDVSNKAKEDIDRCLNFKQKKYVYYDFDCNLNKM